MAIVIEDIIDVNNRTIQSICWSCKNAWPRKCDWIANEKRVWKRAYRKTFSSSTNKKYVGYIVQECKFYVPEPEKGARK